MAETELLHRLLAFILEAEIRLTKGKARSVAGRFTDVEHFLSTAPTDYGTLRYEGGIRSFTLTEIEITVIELVQRSGRLDPARSVRENFLAAVARDFIRRQLKAVDRLKLDDLTPNPFLVKALGLRTPEEVVRLNVYMAATRSMVTSMGFFFEVLMELSSETVRRAPRKSGWDLVKTRGQQEHWIQAKSGPKDMDKDQIVHWDDRIRAKVKEGHGAHIGIAYGTRETESVTIALFKQHLTDWTDHTLIGKELWQFLSDDEGYVETLLTELGRAARQVLGERSIVESIDERIDAITDEFVKAHGDGSEGVEKYLADIC